MDKIHPFAYAEHLFVVSLQKQNAAIFLFRLNEDSFSDACHWMLSAKRWTLPLSGYYNFIYNLCFNTGLFFSTKWWRPKRFYLSLKKYKTIIWDIKCAEVCGVLLTFQAYTKILKMTCIDSHIAALFLRAAPCCDLWCVCVMSCIYNELELSLFATLAQRSEVHIGTV